jgi:hypothetical protein
LCLLSACNRCARKAALPPDVIVRVSDRMMSLPDFKRYLDRNAGTDLSQLGPEVASAMLDQYVEETILSEYAATHGVEVPAEQIAAAVRKEGGSTVLDKRDEMRRQTLLSRLSADVPDPSDADVRSFYEAHPDEFRNSEAVRVRQILVHEENLANAINERLKKGESFEALSREHSLAPNAKRGGEIGYVSRGELPKMFEDVIFALQPGQASAPIRTDSSFHIFQVDERRSAGTVDLATAAPAIKIRLREEAVRQRVADVVASSRRDMQVAVLTKRLPFKYSGTLPTSENE